MESKKFSWLESLLVMTLLGVFMLLAPRANAVVGLGTQSFELGTSTPAAAVVLIAPGTAGNFIGITLSSGAAGDFCDVFDSSATTNVALSADGKPNAAPPSKRIGTLLVAATNTTTSLPVPSAAPFSNGIAIVCNAARRVVGVFNQ